MAVFNPQVPGTQDPNYLSYSRPVEAPSPDLSTGMALKSIGEGVAGVIGIADEFVKNTAKEEAKQAADSTIAIRAAVLKTQTPDSVVPAPVQTPQGAVAGKPIQLSGSQSSLLDANASMDTPAGVDEGISRIDALSAARSGGKINDTYYTANLYSEAKRLRAKYPGYRDYIDQEIAHVTGINPAKAYLENMMQDINQQRTAGQKTTDKILGELLTLNKEGVGGAPEAVAHFMRTNDIPSAVKWMNEVKSTEYQVKGLEAGLALDKNSEEQTRRRMESSFSLKAEGHVNNIWSAASMSAGVQTPEQISEHVRKSSIGEKPLSSSEQQSMALNITAQRNAAEIQLRKMGEQLIEIKRSDGSVIKTSYSSMLGEKFSSIVNEKLKRFDVVREAIVNDKTGTATHAATVNQRVKADYENGIVTDPANEQLLAIEYLNRTAGPNWTNIVTKKALEKDVDGVVSGLLTNKTVNAAAGPRPGKPAPSFKQDVSEAVTGKNTVDGSPIDPKTKYFDRLVDNIGLLTVPTVKPEELAGQKNIADYFFDPRNRNVLSTFKLDIWDASGNKIPGRESVFRTLTTPEVSSKIKKLSETDPNLITKYRNWVEYEWGQKIFSPQLNQMKDFFEEGANASKVFTDPRGVNVAFNDKDNQIYIIDNKGRPIDHNIGKTTVEQNYFDFMRRNVNTLNEGLRNLSVMHKELGGDTTKYLLDTMRQAGIDISTNKLGNAIVNSTEEAGRRIEENLKKSGLRTKPPVGMEEEPIRTPTGALR